MTSSNTFIEGLATIGVYGFSEENFFKSLQESNVKTLCDVRQRRAVRGSRYAFANSKRLQAHLAKLGINYVHLKELAPTSAIRQLQKSADRASATTKQKRETLSPEFVQAYKNQCLCKLDLASLKRAIGEHPGVVAFLCVEKIPSACHRSLVAADLSERLNISPRHLMPCE